jgi:hypothetical protein
VIDGHMSAQKAEQIYDQKQVLRSIKDHIMKLEVEQSADEIQGLPRNGDLDSRISAAHARREAQEAKIVRMESDYQNWLRDNA